MNLGQVGQTLERKLAEAFRPEALDVIDESAQHHGHSGARPDGESHFRVRIVSPLFLGKSRVERHRMVNGALAAELVGRVHALAIEAKAPGEDLRIADVAADDDAMVALLRSAGLPCDDLAGPAKRYIGLFRGGALLACGGYERAGGDALIRSVAVVEAERGKGLGRIMAAKIIGEAREAGAGAAYLLTFSARTFFAALGFVTVARADVPQSVAATSQFTGSTCAKAEAMRLGL